MKKVVAALVALAMILVMAPAVFAETGVTVKSGTNVAVAENASLSTIYRPSADGILKVSISGNPGFRVEVQNAVTLDTIGLPQEGTQLEEVTFELAANTKYKILLSGFNPATWGSADATLTYTITFTEGVAVEPVEIDKSTTALTVGTNNVTLLENTTVSLYDFIPTEPGIYTITVAGSVTMATYGFSAWNKLADAENGVIVHTVTAAEQTFLVGLTADTASVTVTIEKTGEYIPPVQIEYVTYVPTCPVVSNFTDPADLVNIDINKEHNVVLGSDGYYHLGSVDGPVIYVNLNTNQFTLALLFDAGAPITMRGTYTDEEGEEYHYDFMEMISDKYYDYSRENDYHPLNKDLMIFLKAYGTSQGWYKVNTSSFTTIQSGEFLEASAWLASCYSTVSSYVPSTEPSTTPTQATTAPSQATTAPSQATTAPTQVTNAPEATTAPTQATNAPEATTAPTQATNAPEATTAPTQATNAPEATAAPTQATNAPEATAAPTQATNAPEATTAPTQATNAPEANAPDTKVQLTDGISENIPQALIDAGCDTVEKIQAALRESILAADENAGNTAFYDAVLMYQEGDGWVKADEEHFPEDGKLKVVLPYPEGTDANTKFTAAHMFTSAAFGKTPGDVETLQPENTEEGIAVYVTGLSPIALAWNAEAAGEAAPDQGEIPENPVTGDTGVAMLVALMLVAALGMVAVVVTGKKRTYNI